jgi:hypothetical protein
MCFGSAERSTAAVVSRDGASVESVEGRDAVFYGRSPGTSYALLSGDGLVLRMYKGAHFFSAHCVCTLCRLTFCRSDGFGCVLCAGACLPFAAAMVSAQRCTLSSLVVVFLRSPVSTDCASAVCAKMGAVVSSQDGRRPSTECSRCPSTSPTARDCSTTVAAH